MSIVHTMTTILIFITIFAHQVASTTFNNVTSNNNNNIINNVNRFSNNSSVFNKTIASDNYYVDDIISSSANNRVRRSPMYQNEFAVYIPSGSAVADNVASKYGFSNMGQVSLFSIFHLNL